MPKSRGRKPRQNRHQRDLAAAATMWPIMQRVDAAEVRGDVAVALDLIMQHPQGPDGKIFWRPERVRRLSQLFVLGPVLPRWATTRWVLAQALQTMDGSTRRIGLKAHACAARVRGDRPMLGVDSVDAHAKVLDHDWVYRQTFLYELGGLDHFLSRVASHDLLAGADRVQEWMRAPMGAYRLALESPRSLAWDDLGSGERVTTINLGAATLLGPGDCALGRVVPTDEGPMFEGPPLRVPESTAQAVAADPPGWIETVAAGCRETPMDDPDGCHPEFVTFAMLTDVPDGARHALMHVVADRDGRSTDEHACDLVGLAAGLVRAAAEDRLGVEHQGVSPWPSVAAALLDPYVTDRLQQDDDLEAWQWWELAEMLPRPASDVCAALADMRDKAA